jgi:hypothetical protein
MTHEASGVAQVLRGVARAILPGPAFARVANEWVYRRWLREGRPIPPPNVVKWKTVRTYGRRFGLRTFVETGTHAGEMVHAVRHAFQRIVSIELHPELHRGSRERFASYPHIAIFRGDSETVLPLVLTTIVEPCLFWLDAHITGGTSGRGALDTPIVSELQAILTHEVRQHVILIDDARLFTGDQDYPTLQAVEQFVREHDRDARFAVVDDVIRICPGPAT